MSYDQEYSPPTGTKYQWHPKRLNYSPWVCDISNQAMPDAPWPFRIAAFVEKSGKSYTMTLEVCDWAGTRTTMRGRGRNAIDACLWAESLANEELERLTPKWIKEAIKNGWRTPWSSTGDRPPDVEVNVGWAFRHTPPKVKKNGRQRKTNRVSP